MTRRLLATIGNPNDVLAKVYRDPDTYGFLVQWFIDGKHRKQADYETNDRDDAMRTASHWCAAMSKARKG